jgi:hypothetical protein
MTGWIFNASVHIPAVILMISSRKEFEQHILGKEGDFINKQETLQLLEETTDNWALVLRAMILSSDEIKLTYDYILDKAREAEKFGTGLLDERGKIEYEKIYKQTILSQFSNSGMDASGIKKKWEKPKITKIL